MATFETDVLADLARGALRRKLPEHVEPGYGASIFSCLPLGIIEISGNSNNGLINFMT